MVENNLWVWSNGKTSGFHPGDAGSIPVTRSVNDN